MKTSDDELIRELCGWAMEAKPEMQRVLRGAAARIADLRANHVLAAGIIAGVGFATGRTDLRDHSELMRRNLGLITDDDEKA